MKEKVIYRCEFIFADEFGRDVFVMNFDQFKTVASVTKFYLLLTSNNPQYIIRIGKMDKIKLD